LRTTIIASVTALVLQTSCGRNVDGMMSAAVPFATSQYSQTVALEAHVPPGAHIISLFFYVPPDAPSVESGPILAKITLAENGILKWGSEAPIDLSEQQLRFRSVPTITPGAEDNLSKFKHQSESNHYEWPYYTAIDKRPGRIYRSFIAGIDGSPSGKNFCVTAQIMNSELIPDELKHWQLRIDPYTGK